MRAWKMPFGAEVIEQRVHFRVFAPVLEAVGLKLGDAEPLPMNAAGDGWFELATGDAAAGTRYKFVLPDGTEAPDPISRFQPTDVSGPSEVIDPADYEWNDAAWKGRSWEQAVLYELHVGTFTPEGTFPSATGRLDHLAQLGVTAIELMCVSDFAGNRNWGYDGVLLYAPDSAYGRPEEMKAFIDAAHALGIMVILDVVYNHFGPEGNYITRYMPRLFSEQHETPWGQALNFDGPGSAEVRALIVENACYWVEEFHLDGLRLDASHAMIDESPKHILDELRERVLEVAGDRHVHLILENEVNIAERLLRNADGSAASYSAQWNHDITHLLAAVMGKSCTERAEDDGGETEKLAKALVEGFVIAAQENGAAGAQCKVPPTAFISFVQTHDLVGNRIFGDRLTDSVSKEAVRAITAINLLLPQIPMLFMGEEWAASTPFPYFCDYHGELAEQIRKGRCEQLTKQDPAPSEDELKRAPDPQAEGTLRSAQLRWEELESAKHAEWLRWYMAILQVRREAIVPLLRGLAATCGSHQVIGPGGLKANWTLDEQRRLHLAANLCEMRREGFGVAEGKTVWVEGSDEGGTLGPWGVRWSVSEG